MLLNLRRAGVLTGTLIAALSLTAAGCSSKTPLASVSGVVMLDGKPMPEALVEFLPDSDKGTHGPVSGGMTDAEGRFQLVCYEGKLPGAVVGRHRILVQDARSIPQAVSDATPVKPPPPKPSRIPTIYASVAETPLREEVKPGAQTVTVEVKSKSSRR